MRTKEKITKLREMFITQTGRIPNAVILGEKPFESLKEDNPHRALSAGSDYCGMRIIIDKEKQTRVEVGDFEIW